MWRENIEHAETKIISEMHLILAVFIEKGKVAAAAAGGAARSLLLHPQPSSTSAGNDCWGLKPEALSLRALWPPFPPSHLLLWLSCPRVPCVITAAVFSALGWSFRLAC